MSAPKAGRSSSAKRPRTLEDRELAFATCRSMGHEWRHRDPIGIDDTEHDVPRPFGMRTGMVGMPSLCANCTMRRVRWITRSGEVIVRYEPPDGYARHGDDKLTPKEWRSTYVESVFSRFGLQLVKGSAS